MDVRKKIVELLGSVQQMGVIYRENQMDERYPTIEQIRNTEVADRLIANGVTVPEWIPCSERLPEKYVDASGDLINFMVYMPKYGVDIANYSIQTKTWFCLGVPAKVTHWMPLPEMPQK